MHIRLNWARRASWGWWDDTVLQTRDSKFEQWRSEAEHATSWSRRLPTILSFTRGWGRNVFVSFKPPRPGTEPRGSGANLYLRAPALVMCSGLFQGFTEIQNDFWKMLPKFKMAIRSLTPNFFCGRNLIVWNFSNFTITLPQYGDVQVIF